jgi:hypothetical protein
VRFDGGSTKGNIVTTSELGGLDDWEIVLDRHVIPLDGGSSAAAVAASFLGKCVFGLSILNNGTFAGVCTAYDDDEGEGSELHNFFHHG